MKTTPESSLSFTKHRLAELAVGFSAKKLMDWSFDYLLYPYVIYLCGILYGGVIMTLLSLLSCLIIMKFYDWSQRDWLGIEAIKTLKSYDGGRTGGLMAAWCLRKSGPMAFLFLTFWQDPFITTAYLREGKFNGMNRRERMIFFGSLILCNAYWTLACYMGITLVEWVWRSVKGFFL